MMKINKDNINLLIDYLDEILPEAFAVVREAGKRVLRRCECGRVSYALEN